MSCHCDDLIETSLVVFPLTPCPWVHHIQLITAIQVEQILDVSSDSVPQMLHFVFFIFIRRAILARESKPHPLTDVTLSPIIRHVSLMLTIINCVECILFTVVTIVLIIVLFAHAEDVGFEPTGPEGPTA